MKRSLLILVGMLGLHAMLYAQTISRLPERPKLVIAAGLWTSNSMRNWGNLRIGVETKRQSYWIGVHRLLRFKPSNSSLFAGRLINPWPVGVELWFRHYLFQEKSRWRPYCLFTIAVSGDSFDENPVFYPNPQRFGNWVDFEPSVGYGMRWDVCDIFSITAEAGAGLDIYVFFPTTGRIPPASWPGSFMASFLLEKRF